MTRAGITGTGSYVPAKVLSNLDLEARLDTTDEWIRTRTGIHERRIAAPHEASSDLGAVAAALALADAGISGKQLDLIIVATCTPDHQFPSTAAVLQEQIGATIAPAMDLNAACAGFSYGLDVASSMVAAGGYKRVLVVGAEVMSRTVDWNDRSSCILFGDGAGAVVVEPVDEGGILASALHADGSGGGLLCIPAGGSREPFSEKSIEARRTTMFMNGREVYRFAVQVMGEVAVEALERCDLTPQDISLFIPHQANIRIIESAARRLDLPMDKVFVNLDRYGNTSAASIPLALDEAVRAGRVKRGDIVVTVGFGAGLTWGANVVQWVKDQRVGVSLLAQ